eukprot:scaffold1285_cov243-Pinguiococcus_pyrenoidosus.AAC.4
MAEVRAGGTHDPRLDLRGFPGLCQGQSLHDVLMQVWEGIPPVHLDQQRKVLVCQVLALLHRGNHGSRHLDAPGLR